jgi:hypothetical protein
MLWNELKAEQGVQLFSCENLTLATGQRWAEKYRLEVIGRKMQVRTLVNIQHRKTPLSNYHEYHQYYQARYIPASVLQLKFEMSIYNNTVAIYNSLADESRIGTEITNSFFAFFMRQMFENYWGMSQEIV